MSLISWLSSSQGVWESVEYVGEILVLVGVVLEDWAESIGEKSPLTAIAMASEGEPETEIALTKKEDAEKRKKAVRRATKVLLVGLLLALVGIIRTNRISDERIASLNVEVAKSNERAEQAHGDAAQANERAAELNLTASELQKQLNLGETTQFFEAMPRTFVANSLARLKAFAPQSVDIIVCSVETEPHEYAADIALECRKAGWSARVWTVDLQYLGLFSLGIHLGVRGGSGEIVKNAANELHGQIISWEQRTQPRGVPPIDRIPLYDEFKNGDLVAGNLKFSVRPEKPGDGGWNKRNAASIRIMIGEKPRT